MGEKRYLEPVNGGQWGISRQFGSQTIYLIQDRYVDDEAQIPVILRALGLDNNPTNVELYFPLNKWGQRCPTLELLELVVSLDQERQAGREVGV